jgi:signal peptidase I
MATVVSQTAVESAARTLSAPPTRSRRLARTRTVASVATSAVVLTAAWWFLAPAQLGGSTSFTTVDGTSMLPSLHRSDLVALRAARAYRVGDVAGYHSTLLRRVVLHRIVAIHGDRYVFKGDHNSFLDPDHPTRAQLVGKLWFHVPSAGHAVAALHVPWVVAASAALLVLALGMGDRRPAREAGRRS